MSRTYVVVDGCEVLYAGQDFANARDKLSANNTITVWQQNVWLGRMNSDGRLLAQISRLEIPTRNFYCMFDI